jgi:hypothetical protein
LIADLAWIWKWGPNEAFELTGTQLLWWLEQTNRIIARQRRDE